jgi:hypothetical protein
MGILKKTPEAAVSQSVVGRNNAEKQHGLMGMLANPYVFMTCLFASLGCMMYGYDQVSKPICLPPSHPRPPLLTTVLEICHANSLAGSDGFNSCHGKLPSTFPHSHRLYYSGLACLILGAWCMGRCTLQRIPRGQDLQEVQHVGCRGYFHNGDWTSNRRSEPRNAVRGKSCWRYWYWNGTQLLIAFSKLIRATSRVLVFFYDVSGGWGAKTLNIPDLQTPS